MWNLIKPTSLPDKNHMKLHLHSVGLKFSLTALDQTMDFPEADIVASCNFANCFEIFHHLTTYKIHTH